MKFYIRNLLYGILCLVITICSPSVLAEKRCCSEINVETSISADNNTEFFTNAEVTEKGLAITGVKASTDQYGETVYTPDENKSFLAVNILRHNIKLYDNIIIEVDYADTDHDNQSWLSIKYKGADGKIKYTKPVGMKNSGKSSVTQQFLINDIVFDDFFSGYDFQVVNFINDSKWFYATEPTFIKGVRAYMCDTVSPVHIEIETDNKGNIFYDEDIVAFDVELKNQSAFPADFIANYSIYKLESDGNKTLYKSQEIQYNIDGGKTETAVLEFDVPEYALYILNVTFNGICNEQIIETQYETRFSKCVLNDKVNASFGVSGGAGYSDLLRAAGIGTFREGYTLPYEQGSSYKPPKGWAEQLRLVSNKDIKTTATILLSNGRSLPPESAYEDIYNCVYNFLTDEKYNGNIDKVSIGNEPEAFRYLDDIDISADLQRYEKIGRRYGIIASAAAKAVHDSGLDVKLSAFETNMAHENSVSPSFTRENLYDFYSAALTAMTEKGVIEYFDAYTSHSYMGYNKAEDAYKNNITYIRNILDSYNYGGGNYEIWTTEAGYSSANVKYYANTLYGDEYTKAKNIIKQYTVMKSDRFDGTYCFYNFIDSGIPESVIEARFGMLESASAYNDVPLASKDTYLAVAALNKLIEDSTSCTEVVNADGIAGYLYKGNKRDVYCYWTSEGNATLVEMPFDVDKAVFYDIFGNKISVDITDNRLMLDSNIIYAVIGEPYGISKKAIDKNILNIHGTIESKEKDKKVSLIVLGEGMDIKKDVPTGVKFIEQSVTDENGKFSFRAYVGESNNGFEAYVFSEDSYSPVKFSFFCDEDSYDVALRSGIFKISSLDCGLFNEKDSSIRLKYNNVDVEKEDSALYYAMYKDECLTSAGVFPVKNIDNKTLWVYDTSVAKDIEYDKIKIFLWDLNNGMVPLIDVTEIE